FLLHSTARVAPGWEWLAYISPLYYSGLTKPLVPEVGVTPAAMLVLALLIVILAALSAWLFTRRDLGFALRLLPAGAPTGTAGDAGAAQATPFVPYRPSGAWSLRALYLRALRVGAGGALWWALGTAGYAAWATGVGRQLQSNMAGVAQASPILSTIFARMLDPRAGTAIFLSLLIFSFVPLALCALAISLVGRWAADEETGRTDMLLASPVSRPRALLTTFAAIGSVLLGVSAVLGAAVGAAAAAADLELALANLVATVLGLALILFFVACLGALLSGWLRPGAVSTSLMAFVVGSFVLNFIGPGLRWPDALVSLSIFDAYGSPLVDGWQWPPMLVVFTLSLLLLAAATLRFRHKDLAR
ncbi:MAG TPA: hypothetical protein VFN74_01305, partial [Chloroflexota bacterium]|nr:hypothetical protein [Chloroflexota bacterium]